MYTFNMLESKKKEIENAKKNNKSEKHKKDKSENAQEDSSKTTLPTKQKEKAIQGELKLNIVTLEGNNNGSGSKLPKGVEKDENYYRLKQGIPNSTKFRSIIDIYKRTNRLSSPEEEYNWNRQNTLENKKSKVHIEGKTKKDQEGTYEEILPNKQKQKAIHGEFESLGEDSQSKNYNRILMDNNVDDTNDKKDEDYQVSKGISNLGEDSQSNNSNRTLMDNNVDNTNDEKNEDFHISKGIPKNTMLHFLADVCEEYENEISKEPSGSNIRKDQKDSFEEELPNQQKQDIDDESELNKVACEDTLPDNSDRVLEDNIVNYGSKLWTRDGKDGKYRITQGMPNSTKFRSISNIYACTNRLSPVEYEFNWNLQTKEDPNMNHSAKEDSSIKTNKENVGCKRKERENKNNNEEKDAATSST